MTRMIESASGPIEIQDLRAQPYNETKSNYFREQYLLAASETYDWYAKRWPYIRAQAHMDGGDILSGRLKVYEREIEEVREAREVLDRIQDPTSRDLWKLASEWADVMIVGASIMRARRMTRYEVAEIWQSGQYEGSDEWIRGHAALIETFKIDATVCGLDLAEMVINKLAVNSTHYDASLLPIALVQSNVGGLRQSSFAREMRLTVGGNNTSQIPPLVTSPFGEM